VSVGAWRSLVARTLGVREVAGSNPAAPTILSAVTLQIFFMGWLHSFAFLQ
jgi:hypothetical protein